MSIEPEVSVVIPVHNRADLVAQAILSVVASAGTQLTHEIVVVDDGSAATHTAAVLALCDAYPQCVFIGLAGNQGARVARNIGMARARGRYLKFLDSDDLLLPGALAAECKEISARGADVLVSGWLRADITDDQLRDAQPGRPAAYPGNPYDATLSGYFAPISALLYRRAFVADVQWAPEVRHPDDWFFRVKVFLRHPRVAVWDHEVFVWRDHPGPRESTVASLDYAMARFHILAYLRGEMDRCHALTPERRRRLANYFYRDIYVAQLWDPKHYERLVATIEELVPGFRPDAGVETHWPMRLFGGVLGFRLYVPAHNFVRRLRDRVAARLPT